VAGGSGREGRGGHVVWGERGDRPGILQFFVVVGS